MAAFTPGNIVVYRVGTGGAALNGNATEVFIDEYTPTGAFVQTIALPTTDSLPNQTLTASGTATSEGLMTRSVDGHYLVLAGYDAAVGTLAVAGPRRRRSTGSSSASPRTAQSARRRR